MFERVAGELRATLGVDSAAICARAGDEACGAKARSGRASRRGAETHTSTQVIAGVEGAGGSGGHGRASRSTTPSEARVWRSRGRPGPTAPGTPAVPHSNNTGPDGERAGRPRGGRRSVGGTSDNSRIYSPARRSTSCMMRPHTALTHATAATPRTRERQGRICRKSSKP